LLHERGEIESGPFDEFVPGTLMAVSAIRSSLARRAERAVRRDLG
jgi:hypothetical protein